MCKRLELYSSLPVCWLVLSVHIISLMAAKALRVQHVQPQQCRPFHISGVLYSLCFDRCCLCLWLYSLQRTFLQQKTLTNDEDRQNIKTLTINALEQIEHLKTLPPSKAVDIDALVDQLENLAPPTKTLGHPEGCRSLPRGDIDKQLM